jgi:ABC-type uncharacterized transport system substrate-binding protein
MQTTSPLFPLTASPPPANRLNGGMRTTSTLLGLGLAVALAAPATAHPHVFIDMRSAVSFNAAGQVDAIGISWTFDEFYTQFATDGIDRNGNGKFDPAELQELANSYVKNLKEYRYFTFIELGGKLIDNATPTNARAMVKDGQLTFVFRVPLSKPADPAAMKVSFTSFDPTYYIDIAPAENTPVSFAGAPKGCSHTLRKVDTTQAGALSLAGKVRMMAPTDDVLNSTTASIIDVTCSKTKSS